MTGTVDHEARRLAALAAAVLLPPGRKITAGSRSESRAGSPARW
jgi:hypothetical protein